MVKIEKYKVLSAWDGDNLTAQVNNFIFKGWQPYGNLCYEVKNSNSDRLYQAMVKYEDTYVDPTQFGPG